jgi:hypothetical protein
MSESSLKEKGGDTPMKRAVILMKTLKLDDESTPEFAVQLKQLTIEDKKELSDLGAKLLGVVAED